MSPLARPLASSGHLQDGWTDGSSAPIGAAKDSSSDSSSARSSARTVERVAADLSGPDRDVLLFVQSVRLVSGAHLRRRFWPGDDSAARASRRALRRLSTWRVLDRIDGRRGGVRAGSEGFIYVVGPVGHRVLAGLGFYGRRQGVPGERYIAHTLAIAEVAVGLHEAAATGALELIEIQTEPTCWRPFLGAMGARVVLKPDLFVRLGAGSAEEDRWFIEIDRATEAAATLGGKIKRYQQHYRSGDEQHRHGIYPRVIWAVPDVRRAGVLNDVLARFPHDARRLHVVTTHAALVPFLTAEAQS